MSTQSRLIKPRETSISFRRFNRRHASLSSHYWTHVLGTEAIKKNLKGANPTDLAVDALELPMKQQEFGFDVGRTLTSIDDYLNTSRLHILTICLAQLEAFLKEISYCVARIRDPSPRIGGLSPMANAMAKPILGVDSLPGPLDYSESFLDVNLASQVKILKTAYKYRCAAVHNGGYATPRTRKDLGRPDLLPHQKLSFKWSELKPILAAAYEVADLIDQRWSGSGIYIIECEVELDHLKRINKLPNRDKVWGILADAGFKLPPKPNRERIASFYYAKATSAANECENDP
jgi:hypothetical protein